MPVASHPSAELATFASTLRYTQIPDAVVQRCKALLLDSLGCSLAGARSRPVLSMEKFAMSMGPRDGPSEVLISRRKTSPMFAAMVNAASAHMLELDDVHNGAVLHPGTVVFPGILAMAQALGASGKALLTAAVAGYEVGIRVGEFLGRSHYKVFHTTATAGTLAAAAAAGRLLELSPGQMLDAFGSAGTQAAGLWEFLRDAADAKQLHSSNAVVNGMKAAYLAQDGFTGAKRILEGPQGMAAGMSTDADPARLTDRLGARWALAETSFKYHASCRHTHPAADALLAVMREQCLQASQITRVVAHVHQSALDILGPISQPATVLQSKFCMGHVLAIAALRGRAGLRDFDACFADPEVLSFREKVRMRLDAQIEACYPARWIGKVTVGTTDGRELDARVDEPKGDPGNSPTRAEIEEKFLQLATYAGAARADEVPRLMERVWNLEDTARIGMILAA
ncbi:MAG TPA: MmgE/PrpD family protein [Bordetella sp.]|uniref:MmgE/PrpD family protein n=1 Tax=Bordetella sp. TaxID=28081 RepID=UPI002ED638E6